MPASVTSNSCGRPGAVLERRARPAARRGPRVELALDALAVGVQRGGEPALVGAQLAQHEVGGLRGHPLRHRAAPAGVEAEQLGVVVEHLLEVRHHPAAVDGVAREAAAELVVHPATRHRLAGGVEHPPRVGVLVAACAAGTRGPSTAGTSAPRRTRRWPCRTHAPAAGPPRSRTCPSTTPAASERLQAKVLAQDAAHAASRRRGGSPRRPRSPAAPGRRTAARAAAGPGSRCRRRTGSPSWSSTHVIGQPPWPVIAGRGLHVDRVHVRPLLAVDLDADEVLVEVAPPWCRPRTTRAPSRGTSGTRRTRRSATPARCVASPRRTPPRPTPTSRRDFPRVARDMGLSRHRDGSCRPSSRRPQARPFRAARVMQGPALEPCTHCSITVYQWQVHQVLVRSSS